MTDNTTSTAAAIRSSSSRSSSHHFYKYKSRSSHGSDGDVDVVDDDDDGYWYFPDDHEMTNSSITTSVTIHITPDKFSGISWVLLWIGFVLAIGLGTYQVYKESQWMTEQKRKIVNLLDLEQAGTTHNNSNNTTPPFYASSTSHPPSYRSGGSGGGGRHGHSRGGGSGGSGSHSSPGAQAAMGDAEMITSADLTRSLFRRLLLLALTSRAILMPIQIWVNPFWCQLIADTLPEMAFASAWTLLVSFFVQLVSVASGGSSYPGMNPTTTMISTATSTTRGGGNNGGTGTGAPTSLGNTIIDGLSSTPGIVVIQWTAMVVYVMLVTTYLFWSTVASAVLLYAFLCCIYAALFGTSLYFGPRLFTLLQPSFIRTSSYSALSIRLGMLTLLCIWVFGAQTYGMARRVVAPPNRGISWWWQYGILELIPAALCLLMIKHRMVVTSNNNNNNGNGNGSSNTSNRSDEGGGATTTTAMSSSGAAAAATTSFPSNFLKPPAMMMGSGSGGGMTRRSESHGSMNNRATTNTATSTGSHRIASSSMTNVSASSSGGGGGGSESVPLLKSTMAYGATITGGGSSAGAETNT